VSIRGSIRRLSAKTTLSFSKIAKTAQFLFIFAKNEPLFAKNVPKFAKSAPKTLDFGTHSQSRRCFLAKNAGRAFLIAAETFISP